MQYTYFNKNNKSEKEVIFKTLMDFILIEKQFTFLPVPQGASLGLEAW